MPIKLKKETSSGVYTKEDVEAREPYEIVSHSVTQLSMALRCPRQRFFRYRIGLKIPPGGAMIIGRGVHKGAEMSLKKKQKTGKLLKDSDAKDICVEYTRKVLKEEPWDGEANAGDLIDDSAVMMDVWQEKVGPKKKPLHPESDEWPKLVKSWEKVKHIDFLKEADEEEEIKADHDRKEEPFTGIEAGFTIKLPGVDHPVSGFIDVIEQLGGNRVEVTDTKTSGKRKSELDLRTYQLWLYGLVCRAIGLKPVRLKYDVIIRPRPKLPGGDYQPLSIQVGDDTPYKHVVAAFRYLEKMDADGSYPPNYGQHCSWCGYRDLCDKVSSVKTFAA